MHVIGTIGLEILPFGKHHSNNCCRQKPLKNAEKYDKKQDNCIASNIYYKGEKSKYTKK